MCLMFRLIDLRESQIVESHVRLQLFHPFEENGRRHPYYQQDLEVQYDWLSHSDKQDQLFILLPLTIIHIIDEKSPFYNLTPEKLSIAKFELIAVLDGIVESTGMNTQAKTSYLPNEILWGYDFVNVISDNNFDEETGKFWVDFTKHDQMFEIDLANSSSKEHDTLLPSTSRPSVYV